MKCLKLVMMIVLFAMAPSILSAQSGHTLKGLWQTTYVEDGQKALVTYEILEANGSLEGHVRSLGDGEGNHAAYNTLA